MVASARCRGPQCEEHRTLHVDKGPGACCGRRCRMKTLLGVAAAMALSATAVHAQSADTILVNGKILTVDKSFSVAQALAIRGERIVGVGSNEEIRSQAGADTKIMDLGGRTVIPGLIDSHIHALRAGLTYAVELSWIGVPSLAKGLELIREAARTSRPNAWIKIGGGWTELQFPEKRGPTVEELVAAAPDRPVYVQRLYNTAWITPAGIRAMGLTPDTQIPTGKSETDANGNLTGVFTGGNPAFNFLTAKIPSPTFEEQVEGTKRYFRELNRLGMTGIHDVVGGGFFPVHYRPTQILWQRHQLSVRVAFRYQTQARGSELATFQDYVKFTPQGFGDDMMRF